MEEERIKKAASVDLVTTTANASAAAGTGSKVRFITAHQHRMDSATALTLSTAKKFGLNCSVLATSVDNSSFKVNRLTTDTLHDSVSNYTTNENTPIDSEGPGKFVLWQFTL
eukprot:GDKK01029337.1.p1 GENE.GDKK01029337.1~~GDKK01029337.1.p1  ORF type:complete len:121 (+),score=16.70 GDKK01029337.1:29-364(+)